MNGNYGIGVISDRYAQPLLIGSKFGAFAIVYTGLIENTNELAAELIKKGDTFGELSSGGINSVEVLAKLINQYETLVEGLEKLYDHIMGSASILLMKEDGIYAVRDRLGRTPLVIGEKNGN